MSFNVGTIYRRWALSVFQCGYYLSTVGTSCISMWVLSVDGGYYLSFNVGTICRRRVLSVFQCGYYLSTVATIRLSMRVLSVDSGY